jgi:hypothetical protein
MRRMRAIAVAIASLAATQPAMAQHSSAQHSSAGGEVVPVGTPLMVRLLTALSTKTQRPGSRFEAVLQEDLRSGDRVIAHAGTTVYGVVTRSKGGKKVGKQELAATLSEIKIGGRLLPIVTDTAGAKEKYGGGLAMVGSGSLLGAAIGGGTGALIGGAAGLTGTAISKEKHITVAAGTVGTVHLRAPLHIP